MKVVKDLTHGILLHSFAAQEKSFLVVSVLTFFDLDAPDAPLSEQDMWRLVPKELGDTAILDAAMPKQGAEVLLRAGCYAPRGETRQASQASFRVGEVARRLNVFGPRRWESRAGVQVITDPEPFTWIDLTWKNALGGPDFAPNPLGMGLAPVMGPDGREFLPLPLVEDPEHLIGSTGDRPEPAGFLPLDQAWPQRMKKAGTYDQKWFNERWPYFPEDMDWTFFNAAPEAQRQPGFFQGGEPVELVNMHPERRLIASSLPRLRQRVFLNQWMDLKHRDKGLVFKEAKTSLDTVWLIPHALRGITIHRAVFETVDEEYPDAGQVYLVTESPDQPPKSMEHHFEALTRRLDRSVQVDTSQMDAALAQAAQDMKLVKDIPKALAQRLEVIKGAAPDAGISPKNAASQCMAVLDQSQVRLDEGIARLEELRKLYGHVVKIDTAPLAKAKETFLAMKGKIENTMAKADALTARAAQAKTRMQDAVLGALGRPQLQDHLAAVKAQMAEKPVDLWPREALELVRQARYDLSLDLERTAALRKLGLRPVALKRALIGAVPPDTPFAAEAWGLDPAGTLASLPPGLLLSAHVGAKIARLVIRPGELTDASADVEVPGSQATTFTAGMALGKPVVRVADPLEAWLVEQDATDFVGVVALADPGEAPDKDTAALMKDAPRLLVTLYSRDPGGRDKEFAPWKKAWPQAEPLPLPEKSAIFDAREKGVELEEWILEALGPGQPAFIPEDSPFRAKKGPDAGGIPLPLVDAKGLVQAFQQGMNDKMAPMLQRAEALKAELPEKARALMTQAGAEKHGINPKDFFDPATLPKRPEGFMAGLDLPGKFAQVRASLAKAGQLTPERAAVLDGQEGKMTALLADGQARWAEGQAKLPGAGGGFAFPDWAKKLLEPFHIDPDDREVMTREKVVFRHANAVSLKGKNLSGLDLSGLDLSDADLRGAQMQKTSFAGSRLDGADISGVIADEADFTGASFTGGKAVQALLGKAVFAKAALAGTDFRKALLKGANLAGADLSGATLEETLLEDAALAGANLSGTRAVKGYFMGADLSGADFTEAQAGKALFFKSKAPGADFSGTDLGKAVFWSASADKARFHGCNLDNARFGGETSVQDADFTDTRLEKASLMDVNLARGDFRGARFKRSFLRGCDLSQSDLSGITAERTRFHRVNLEGAKLTRANLNLASLRRARLVKADLSGANLFGVEFYKAVAGDTDFTEANLKMTLLHKRAELLDDQK